MNIKELEILTETDPRDGTAQWKDHFIAKLLKAAREYAAALREAQDGITDEVVSHAIDAFHKATDESTGPVNTDYMMRVMRAALQSAARALQAKPAIAPEGWRLAPIDPTPQMLDRAVAFALNVKIGGDYGWTQYMQDLWSAYLAAAPKPEK